MVCHPRCLLLHMPRARKQQGMGKNLLRPCVSPPVLGRLRRSPNVQMGRTCKQCIYPPARSFHQMPHVPPRHPILRSPQSTHVTPCPTHRWTVRTVAWAGWSDGVRMRSVIPLWGWARTRRVERPVGAVDPDRPACRER